MRYLSSSEFAERIGVQPDTLNKYKMPKPDAMTGKVRGWLPETVDAWNAARPGKGNRNLSALRWLKKNGVAVKGEDV